MSAHFFMVLVFRINFFLLGSAWERISRVSSILRLFNDSKLPWNVRSGHVENFELRYLRK